MDDIYGRINARDGVKGRGKRIRMRGEGEIGRGWEGKIVIQYHHTYPGFLALITVILRLSCVLTNEGGGDEVAARWLFWDHWDVITSQ